MGRGDSLAVKCWTVLMKSQIDRNPHSPIHSLLYSIILGHISNSPCSRAHSAAGVSVCLCVSHLYELGAPVLRQYVHCLIIQFYGVLCTPMLRYHAVLYIVYITYRYMCVVLFPCNASHHGDALLSKYHTHTHTALSPLCSLFIVVHMQCTHGDTFTMLKRTRASVRCICAHLLLFSQRPSRQLVCLLIYVHVQFLAGVLISLYVCCHYYGVPKFVRSFGVHTH